MAREIIGNVLQILLMHDSPWSLLYYTPDIDNVNQNLYC